MNASLPSWMVAPVAVEGAETSTMQLTERRIVAADVVELVFRPIDGEAPCWEPGAHIDLHLPDERIRQYSLTGDPNDRTAIRIAVLRDASGRGGSRFLHDDTEVGDLFEFGSPRNHFELADAERYVFIAGGIGITPLLPMLRHVRSLKREWSLVYLGRTLATMAYLNELPCDDTRLTVITSDGAVRWQPERALAQPQQDTKIYCCGPERLHSAVESATSEWAPDALHIERFRPRATPDIPRTAFDVGLKRSGIELHVPAGLSLIDALRDAGIRVPSSCNEGTCGTCEVAVLGGVPQHRDSVLSASEQAAGDCMMACVSRANAGPLIIDV